MLFDAEPIEAPEELFRGWGEVKRLSKDQESVIYQDMSRAVRNKLIALTFDTISSDLFERFFDHVQEALNRNNKLSHLIEHKSFITIVSALDELKVFALLGEERSLRRSKRKLQRALVEWPLPNYIAIQSAEELLSEFDMAPGAHQLKGSERKLKKHISHYKALRNKLTDSNIGLVYKIASRFFYLGLAREDVIQEGSIGLMKAIERFDPNKGYQFSSYAYRVISQQIHSAIEVQSALVRRPFNELRHLAVVDKTRMNLEQTLLRPPRGREFDKALPDSVGNKYPHIVNNIDASADDHAMHVYPTDPELFATKDGASQNFETQFRVYQDRIEKALKKLDRRSEKILRMRYGIGINRTYTLAEISSALQVSGERARQISLQALQKLSVILGDASPER